MSVDLYDSHYGHAEADVYREIRRETFGEDLGQTSWITARECDAFRDRLGLPPGGRLLDVACGTGGVALRMASRGGASAVGVDISGPAIVAAARAAAVAPGKHAEFRVVNADEPLPFDDSSFDAVFCNDAINHFEDRERVLADWYRVLKPGGRCLFTDPIVVTGCLSNTEIAARSSIGFFLFTPLGENEAFLENAGFELERTDDLTEAVATVSRRWLDARSARREALVEREGAAGYDELQRFLRVVHVLAAERRLSRFAYLSRK